MNNIEKQLKNLQSIQPDPDYAKRSRILILAFRQKSPAPKFGNIFELIRTSAIVAFGLFLLITLIGGAFYVNKNYSPLALDGLNQQSLLVEAENMNNSIEMTLGQIKYLDQTNQKTLDTINQVAKDQLAAPAPTSSESISPPETTQTTSTIESIENYLIEKPGSTDDGGQKIDDLLEKISE